MSSTDESRWDTLAYDNGPTQERARRADFRLHAPKRGKAQPGVGKIRNAVKRCPNFFAQFGHVFRRFDRSARHYFVRQPGRGQKLSRSVL